MQYTPYNDRQQRAQQTDPTVLKGREDYADNACPECGQELPDEEFAEKHSVQHYGDLQLPNQGHFNLVARQRQAKLRGWDIPER